MAKKKIELFTEIHCEKEFDNIIKYNPDQLICAEIYSYAFGSCMALDRLFTTIKLDWSEGKLILLKVPADEIEALQRFRHQSEPVYMFILNMKTTKVFRGVDSVKFAEVAKKELDYHRQELGGISTQRMFYELHEPTPDEMEWMTIRATEKEQEATSLTARRLSRQAVRKRHRAELMVPYLTDVNFVLFWPHCYHAHPELYERWDANNIVMVGREEIELTPEKITDIFYAGDAPLNEASVNKLQSGRALAICFRLLDEDVSFVALVRRILYEEIQPYDESSSHHSSEMKTAFDRYKTLSPTREEVWTRRREEREEQKANKKRRRARFLSEMQRLAQLAKEEALEAKRQEKEQRKLLLLKSGNLGALDQLNEERDDDNVDVEVPEELSEEEEEEEDLFEEDDDEYFPPPGLLVPGFYAPPNDIAKANGLAVLFPKLVLERVTPQPEFLPRHVLVLLEISKRYKAIDAIAPFKYAIIHMGIFKATSPYNSVHIAYTVKQFDTVDNNTQNLDQVKIAFMISMEVDIPLLHLMDLNPIHVSRDCSIGEEECAAMFPVDYGDEIDQFEDFV
ncbi:uncharacterized protein LOC113505384 isoform X3 [Trichoplusia ni]|uniref:Uncharacterized protein LOC113505384 isoform X3 n=1 Tax=Trichoplusia ni TaxID=7111 RepID=A0A7E5WSR0_TRINI|nr:uncharacterized protein LOC113505384 isoform X3 [Trichoplusia ni]